MLVLIENQLLGIAINFFSVGGTFVFLIAAGLFAYLARIGIIPLPAVLQKIFTPVAREEADWAAVDDLEFVFHIEYR